MMGSKAENHEIFFKLLNKCSTERISEVIHYLVDFFCGQKRTVYEEFSNIWSLTEWWDLVHESHNFFSNYHSVKDEILNFSALSEDFKSTLKECLDIRKQDIENSLLAKSHAISPCYLTDFDWKLKLTLSSDKMAQINEPRLLLDLMFSGNNEKSLQLDLSKEELKSLIDTLDKTKKALGDVTIPD